MFSDIDKKWQKRWEDAKVFEGNPDDRKKFFVNLPYPYMNGYMHLGRAYTFLKGDIISRYKRMRGYNTIYPFAFHCTGTPIIAAAERIADGEEIQVNNLKKMGVPEEEIENFKDPVHWTQYFSKKMIEHLKAAGFGIDWRRSFITTSLNPYYNKFIEWQFRKLKEKGLVAIGEHPVIWCPKCQNPVGDHARLDGEGETPQEFTLLKFEFGEAYIVAATLRPETIFGQTNLWVDPEIEYVRARVDGETWIMSEECAEKLRNQEKDVGAVGSLKGKELLGKYATAPGIERKIMILPSTFCDPDRGTGIVTSVPSDAPDDWMGLYDLQKDKMLCKKYSLDWEAVKKIHPIPIIKTKGFGELPAVEICKELGIKSQKDRELLEKAKKKVYSTGFYTGKMNEHCEKYEGLSVMEAKEEIKEMLIDSDKADTMYEPSGEVVCRCLTKCIVKTVGNQWFINYGDPAWKEEVHKAVDTMDIIPENVRKQFHYVVDWLNDWACTREFGLGTELPWDKKWLIESLSDSTIYMAFYTISMYFNEGVIGSEVIDDDFFDYIFLGKELTKDYDVSKGTLEKMRAEFRYWYPFDLRSSGKDLVQNHLTFCLFNHTALFPEEYWPQGFAVNGWVTIDGEKMSTSKGNVTLLKNSVEQHGADPTRTMLAFAGEGVDDANIESTFIETIKERFLSWHEFAIANYGKGRSSEIRIDRWIETVTHQILRDVEEAMEKLLFRTVLQRGFFDLQRNLRWYLRRSEKPNKEILSWIIETQTKILAPFAPHISEEIWEKLGKEGFISTAKWPEYNEEKIDEKMLKTEEYIKDVIDDIREILRIAKIKGEAVYLYTAPEWMWAAAKVVKEKTDFNKAIKQLMRDSAMRKRGKAVSKLIRTLIKDRVFVEKMAEEEILRESKEFIEEEVGMKIEVNAEYDPKNKEKAAIPAKPAIYIE
ncbi:MAG: leucine--tRNA ligase [Euryarchaeota archaeon]|nr:leucine--tRNA ligase [Euryarchaeota archaeon]